ncbi:nucleotide sugar dehydrogenase [Corynebacterium sp. HMSC072D12]|uniref:nucleotide sugar dehydrogenase n=1 Tax=Corynebacterium sp. HMSC072D12 TaxID=1739447 RepID=UPI0008A1155E|nr:nucleotide sugar dehydrogenase [Corynebacterium sp. HMSC072D12]
MNSARFPKFDVCVVGLGYVGLPTAALFANAGMRVCGVDIDQTRLENLAKGESNSGEAELDEVLRAALASSNLTLKAQPVPADNYLICVPTPVSKGHSFVSNAVESATKSIAKVVQEGDLLVLESTCPPGTTEHLLDLLQQEREDLRVSEAILAAHCPERVLPGNTIDELRTNSRIIGGCTPEASQRAENLFSNICDGNIRVTDSRTAEMTKLVENTFRDVNIALANELSMICDSLNISINDVRELANMHPRVNLHQSGIGVGGHCISVDPWFIVNSAPELSKLISCARDVNTEKTRWVARKLVERIHDEGATTVGLWGLSYKPETGDLRNSPAVDIAQELVEQLPEVDFIAFDPFISGNQLEFPDVSNFSFGTHDHEVSETNLNILLVRHQRYKSIEDFFDVDATLL